MVVSGPALNGSPIKMYEAGSLTSNVTALL